METKRNTSLSRRLILAAAATAAGVSVAGAAVPAVLQRPQLVVGIFIEGLTAGDLNAYASGYGNLGFNRVRQSGLEFTSVDYGKASGVSATAMLLTGAIPATNGIAGYEVYDRDKRRSRSVVYDNSYMGNFTDETLSPEALRVSTLSDELRVATDGKGWVYSIAPDSPSAIITGGHAGNGAWWINDKDGRWSTSTYYRDTPADALSQRNYRTPLSLRLDTISWASPAGMTPAFRYTFPRRDKDRYSHFKQSARVNDEVTSLALDYLTNISRTHNYGATDMLTLTYTLAEYPYGESSASRGSEQADAYRRLDRQIAQVLDKIESTAGLKNTLVFIAGVPSQGWSRPDDSQWRIPTGEFSMRRAQGLLNMYLMALHGNGDWVTGFSGTHLYLNNKLAEEHNILPAELHREAAGFMQRMSGISDAVTIEDLLLSDDRLYTDAKTAGDVIISINPGWRVVETGNDLTEGKVVRSSASIAPLFIMYPPVGSDKVTVTVDACAIAPTIADILRIRAPNAASKAPISISRRN